MSHNSCINSQFCRRNGYFNSALWKLAWFRRVQAPHSHFELSNASLVLSSRAAMWIPEEVLGSAEVLEQLAFVFFPSLVTKFGDSWIIITSSESSIPDWSCDPHHKSSYILLSAAIAAACTGLSALIISLFPPNFLGPEGNRAPFLARFCAAANVACRRDGGGGCTVNPPTRLPVPSNPCPVPVIPFETSSSHSWKIYHKQQKDHY